ncbi:MAG: response regulator transcription factor [Cryomorphaceae bacterium]|nr:response regulator transcription factor [Cryomorphaceae bacterium]
MHVILADSNDLVRVGLRTILNSHGGVKIVGEARDSKELQGLIKNFEVSVVLIDYTSSGFDIEIIPKLTSKRKDIRFVAITPEQSAQTLVNALRSGVQSYVKKDCDLTEIINAVEETWRGNKFFCGQILETIQRASIDVNDIDFESFSCEPVLLSVRKSLH